LGEFESAKSILRKTKRCFRGQIYNFRSLKLVAVRLVAFAFVAFV